MTKKRVIILIIAIIFVLLMIPYGALVIYQEYHDTPSFWDTEDSEVYIEVPDSDLTVIAKYKLWLQSSLSFYYVDENGERVSLPYVVFRGTYNPFATGDYECSNEW